MMLKILNVVMATLVGFLAAASITAQTKADAGQSSGSAYVQITNLIGRKVESSQGEEIGVIKDVVLDRSNGCMAYTVLSTFGARTDGNSGGGKIVAVPWAVYSHKSDSSVLTVTVGRGKVYTAPAFDYARIDEYTRPDYIDNIYSYYRISPGTGNDVSSSTKPTTATDVTGTAGPTATPGEVASTSETPSPRSRPSAPPHSTAGKRRRTAEEASEDSNPSETPSERAGRSGKKSPGSSSRPSSRDEVDSESETDASATESAATLTGSKETHRRDTQKRSIAVRSATPELPEAED